MKKNLIVLFFCCVLFTSSLFSEEITFTADKMSGSTGENSEYSKLSGNAFIKTKSIEIHADEIILSGEDFRFITASGNVKGKNSESNFDFTCEQMDFDRETEIVVLKGGVTLVDNENDVKASAQLIEFNQKTEIANMQIDVKLLQKKNTCTGANAIYDKNEQTLQLSGLPQIIKDQDTFKANEIFMNLDTEEITLDGKVRGSVTASGDDEKADKTKDKTETNAQNEKEASSTTEKSVETEKGEKVEQNANDTESKSKPENDVTDENKTKPSSAEN